MQPFLTSYATLSSRSLRNMLAFEPIIRAVHADPALADMRLQAIRFCLRWRADHPDETGKPARVGP